MNTPHKALFLILILSSSHAYGYIDPGTGSYIMQFLIAGLVGGGYTVKLYWHRIKAFFVKPSQK